MVRELMTLLVIILLNTHKRNNFRFTFFISHRNKMVYHPLCIKGNLIHHHICSKLIAQIGIYNASCPVMTAIICIWMTIRFIYFPKNRFIIPGNRSPTIFTDHFVGSSLRITVKVRLLHLNYKTLLPSSTFFC